MLRAPFTLSVTLSASLAGLLLEPRSASACGVSASGAPAGICDASDVLDEKSAAAKNRLGVSYGYTSSVLFFSDGLRAPTERHAVMASFEHPMRGKNGSRWTLEVGAGSLLGGYLETDLGRASFSQGVLADVSLSHLIIEPRGYAAPFLLLSLSFAGVWARTETPNVKSTDYVALDFSAAVAAGMSLKVKRHAVTPFIAGRLFGGPVFWTHRDATVLGTDAFKYSVGPGVAVSFDRSRVGLSFGCSLLGEKNAKAGMSIAF